VFELIGQGMKGSANWKVDRPSKAWLTRVLFLLECVLCSDPTIHACKCISGGYSRICKKCTTKVGGGGPLER
jgi:hypothetical protein